MRRIVALFTAAAILCLFAGCSSSSSDKEVGQTETADETVVSQATEASKPNSEATEKETLSITQEEIEAEVEKIRQYYYSPTDEDTKKTLEKGENDWEYSRDYRYHNGKLIFAFVFDGTQEHRLYFKNDHMIRYIDENGTVYDYPDCEAYHEWADKVLDEAYPAPEAEESSPDSEWIGTWTADSGESLEINSVSDTGLSLVFHKRSEQGNMMDVDYVMEFDNTEKTVASEVGGPEDHGGWEYTFILGDGVITVQSRYPDQLYYKE